MKFWKWLIGCFTKVRATVKLTYEEENLQRTAHTTMELNVPFRELPQVGDLFRRHNKFWVVTESTATADGKPFIKATHYPDHWPR